MGFETETKDGIAVVTVTAGRLDASIAPDLKQTVAEIINNGTSRIMLDLESVQFMDSSGLGAVISSFKLTGQKGEFVICNMNEAVKEIFTLTHMDRLFEIYPSADEGFQKMCA